MSRAMNSTRPKCKGAAPVQRCLRGNRRIEGLTPFLSRLLLRRVVSRIGVKSWKPFFGTFATQSEGLVKRPGFTVLALIMFTFGIGSNTVMFSVINPLLLRQLPYKDSDRLVVAL